MWLSQLHALPDTLIASEAQRTRLMNQLSALESEMGSVSAGIATASSEAESLKQTVEQQDSLVDTTNPLHESAAALEAAKSALSDVEVCAVLVIVC